MFGPWQIGQMSLTRWERVKVGGNLSGAIVAGFLLFLSAASAHPQDASPNQEVVAELLFSTGPESYQGTPYFWLARFSLHLTLGITPKSTHQLQFLWGSKNDERTAVVVINGKSFPFSAGGYDGFRWQTIPLPADVAGQKYEIVVTAGEGKAAFLAGVRLLRPATSQETKDDHVSQPSLTVTTRQDLDAAKTTSVNIELEVKPVTTGSIAPQAGEAFPEWRNFWDQPSRRNFSGEAATASEAEIFLEAEENARRAHEQFFRCRRYLDGWLSVADPQSGLIPQNLRPGGNVWTPENSAADNYPFMVLTAAILCPELLEERLFPILQTERKLTNRLDRLPDAWSFATQSFARSEIDLARVIFGASEYVKDGLLPLTEWLGPSPWSERMLEIVDDIWKHAPRETPWGRIPSDNVEVNGEQLQSLCRIYWMTGEEKYLDWAIRLGDYYLLGDHHPTLHLPLLRLRDHGCEIVSGLVELYVTVHFARPEKKAAYRGPIYAMLDRILEIGRDPRGMMYNWIRPQTGEHDAGICDTWGYNYNGIYAVWMIDGHEPYREAIRHVLRHLPQLTDYHWGSADEYADSLEGAINLYNREPIPEAAQWIESEIRDMWRPQQPSGIIEGWHGDGNVARTALMYALWKTQGVTLRPWRDDLLVGAVRHGDRLYLLMSAGEKAWEGKVFFDPPRHAEYLRLPIDYPRINQFPEWFVVPRDKAFVIRDLGSGRTQRHLGQDLSAGLPVTIPPNTELRWIVEPVDKP